MSADTHDSSRPLGEISQAPNALDEFLERNHKKLIILGVIGALAAAGYVLHREIEKGAERASGAALIQADDLASLQKIIKDHPETAAAGSAEILLADKQWQDGQQDASIATLRKFISEKTEHPALATARASLGSKLASQGKADEATKVFEELAADPKGDFLAPFALVSLGDIARSAGNTAKAEEYYLKAQNEYPESTFANSASRRVGLLKAKPPVEIDPPPAPPENAAPIPEAPTNLLPAPGLLTDPAPTPAPVPEAPVAPENPAPEPQAPAPAAPSEPAPAPAEPSPAPKP